MNAINRRRFIGAGAGALTAIVAGPTWSISKHPALKKDLTQLTLSEASVRVKNREISPVELTQACLNRIERLNPHINAFITVTSQLALKQARRAEEEIKKGKWRGPLHGIPIALKDNIDTAGILTTAASAVFAKRIPAEDAAVVVRLKKAGAVLLGKLNMTEFAIGDAGTGTVSYRGPAHNPWSLDYVTGGSSSGSAAAVSSDLCFCALGTDTAGSIRVPASCCGVVGFKPTYGLVSKSGVVPLADSFDHVGPICKTVLDSAIVLQAIAGNNVSCLPDYTAAIEKDFRSLRLGIPKPFMDKNIDPEIADIFNAALTVLASFSEKKVENFIAPENRFDEIVSSAEITAYHKPLFLQYSDLYQPSLRNAWTGVKQKPLSTTDYLVAKRQLQAARDQASEIFQREFDLLVMPTVMHMLPKINDILKQLERKEGHASIQMNTLAFTNSLGLPAISIPCGFTKKGLPVGLQIIGLPFSEDKVLAMAHAYEQATKWHLHGPELKGILWEK